MITITNENLKRVLELRSIKADAILVKTEGPCLTFFTASPGTLHGMAVQVPVRSTHDVSFVVPYKAFMDNVAFSSEDVVEFYYEDALARLQIKERAYKTSLKCYDGTKAEIYEDAFASMRRDINPIYLPEQVKSLFKHAEVAADTGKDIARPVLQNLHVVIQKNKLRVEAADGYAIARGEVEIDYTGEPIDTLFMPIPLTKLNGDIYLSKSDNRITVGTDDTWFSVIEDDGKFPDLEAFYTMPHSNGFMADPSLLKALKGAMTFWDSKDGTFALILDRNGLTVKTRSWARGEFEQNVAIYPISGGVRYQLEEGKYFSGRLLYDLLKAAPFDHPEITVDDASGNIMFIEDSERKSMMSYAFMLRQGAQD